MQIYDNILETIGKTPIVRLNKTVDKDSAEIIVKLESFNPGSSVKDRIALSMIEDAEKSGKLKPGSTIIEPTSGNTGIGLALVSAVKGYKLILTMPDTMSIERRNILKVFGAELVLTPGANGMKGAITKAEELQKENDYFMPQQFNNPANPEIHRITTAQEIIKDTGLDFDAFVSGIGTGGTITGVAEVIKAKKPDIKIIAVEPDASPVLSGGQPGPHKIQGIGGGFIPEILNTKIYDEIIRVTNDEAMAAARTVAKDEGIFVGISGGAALHAAILTAKKLGKGKAVLAILPDTGERYLSTELFSYD